MKLKELLTESTVQNMYNTIYGALEELIDMGELHDKLFDIVQWGSMRRDIDNIETAMENRYPNLPTDSTQLIADYKAAKKAKII